MKINCSCGNFAVWKYSPAREEHYKCNNCIRRGCSCNLIPNSDEEYKDEFGRLLPCVEYEYSEYGFYDDGVTYYDDWSPFDEELY